MLNEKNESDAHMISSFTKRAIARSSSRIFGITLLVGAVVWDMVT